MPITKSALKNLRKSTKNEIRNKRFMERVKHFLKEIKNLATAGESKKITELMPKVYSYVDRASKKHLIHRNKAARIKSSIATMEVAKK